MMNCGACLNCKNGFEAICLSRGRPVLSKAEASDDGATSEIPRLMEPAARNCPCGAPVPKRRRYCDHCRTEQRRETWRESQSRQRCRTVEDLPPGRAYGRPGGPSDYADAFPCAAGGGGG